MLRAIVAYPLVNVALVLVFILFGCGGDECPAGSVAVGDRCTAVDAGDAPDANGDDGGRDLGPGEDSATPPIDAGQDSCVGSGAEVCNGIDDDCNGSIDEGVTTTYFRDADADMFGAIAMSMSACAQPSGYVVDSTDCDDTAPAISPGAIEACNGVDDDCDSMTDEGVTTTFYADADGDMYGVTAMAMMACAMPIGYVATGGDCDDTATATYPGATELCDAADNDCDSSPDEGFACVRGVSRACTTSCGSAGTGACTATCAVPTGAACTPPAEACNFADDDCDAVVDDGVGSLGGATANASTSSVVLLPTASGFIAVYTTAAGIFARTFGAATGSGTPVLVTSTVPTAFDAATNGDDLIVAWSEFDPTASRLSARRFVATTLVPYSGTATLLRTSTDFTFFSEMAIAMTSTQVLIATSQPSAIGFTRSTNALAAVVSGTIRSTADDDRAKLDLVVDPATNEWLLAFENGGALTVQFVSSAGATVGVASPLGAAGGIEVALAPASSSSAPGIFGAAWIEGTTARFETLSGSGFGASRTPVIRSGPTDIRTSVRVVGATAPLLDPVGLTSSGGRWHVSLFDGPSAAAARVELGTSVIGDGTVAPAFTFYASPDALGTSRRATAVVGTAGNRVLLASETTVWRVGCP